MASDSDAPGTQIFKLEKFRIRRAYGGRQIEHVDKDEFHPNANFRRISDRLNAALDAVQEAGGQPAGKYGEGDLKASIFSDDDRAYMMEALKTRRFGMFDKEKMDIYQALEKYENNGKSVKISAPGLGETGQTRPHHPLRIPGMINLPDPGMFAGHETVPLTI
ncbi:hypothetical protein BKA80DRAFT_251399 [Phyllosticta citrichinensis]